MIIRLLSTTLAAAMASTMTGVSQEKAPQAAEVLSASAAAAVSLPVERTLTSTDGRTINVTILDKTATGIKTELNGKTLNIPLSTLSAADQAFIAGCKAAVLPSKKVLYVLEVAVLPADHANVELLKTAGYDVTFGYMRDNKLDRTDAFGKDTPESKTSANIYTAKGYGVYWFATPGKQGKDGTTDGKWEGPNERISTDERNRQHSKSMVTSI